MDPVTTQEQLGSFLGLFSHVTGSVGSALYYAGVFIGFIIFPIYGVVLLRRQTQKYMEKVLAEIAERDPWLWAAAQGMDMFETERPYQWLEDLCRWQARYHGVKIFFGSPDLEAKCVQATKALANVFLSWAQDLKALKPDKKQRLVALVQQLKDRSADPDIEKLLVLLNSAEDPSQWIQDLRGDAQSVRSWFDMVEWLGLPSDLPPEEAAARPNSKQEAAKALLVFERGNCPCHNDVSAYLRALHQRATGTVRITAIQVDKALGSNGELLATLKELIEGKDRCDAAGQQLRDHAAWKKFVVAFGESPFDVLGAQPEDGYASLQGRYRDLTSSTTEHPEQRRKTLALAWDVILLLRKDRLLPR